MRGCSGLKMALIAVMLSAETAVAAATADEVLVRRVDASTSSVLAASSSLAKAPPWSSSPAALTVPLSEETFAALAHKCAPDIAFDTLSALVKTESSFHPFAIAVVDGSAYYPATLAEAQLIAKKLQQSKSSFSVGLGQINSQHFKAFDVNAVDLFEPCRNLQITALLLSKCYHWAKQTSQQNSSTDQGAALGAALSCYFSGNARTGFTQGYVKRVLDNSPATTVAVPSISLLLLPDKHDEVISPLIMPASRASHNSGDGSVVLYKLLL